MKNLIWGGRILGLLFGKESNVTFPCLPVYTLSSLCKEVVEVENVLKPPVSFPVP